MLYTRMYYRVDVKFIFWKRQLIYSKLGHPTHLHFWHCPNTLTKCNFRLPKLIANIQMMSLFKEKLIHQKCNVLKRGNVTICVHSNNTLFSKCLILSIFSFKERLLMSFERITLEIENSQTKVEISTNNKGFRIYNQHVTSLYAKFE